MHVNDHKIQDMGVRKCIDESDERTCVGCHLVATPLLSCYTGIDICTGM